MTGGDDAAPAGIEVARCGSNRFIRASLGVVTVASPFLAVLLLGLPSWFPTGIALDTVTLIAAGASWSDSPSGQFTRLLWSLALAGSVAGLINLRGWAGQWLPPALLLLGLAVPQACLWMTGQSKYCMIGGLVPFSDANGYLDYASQMLENHVIVHGFSNRPMFAAYLSSLLLLSGSNLQVALGILLAICGAGMILATREMHRRFGTVAATCFLFVTYTFYNRSIGMVMTEHLGLTLGLFALVLLLRGLLEPRRRPWLVGIFFLTAALSARAGAFFVLPTLCLFTGRLFKKSGRFSLPSFAIATGIVLISLGLNRVLIVRLFDSNTRPRSNFSYTAYGIVRGTDWTDALKTFGQDHDKIWQATYELLKEKPHLALHAVRRAWKSFFWQSYSFGFMGRTWSRLLVSLMVVGFLFGMARASRSAYDGFTVAAGIGILVSMPCVPPADCDMMRVYAATMPMHACLAASAMGALVRLVASAFRKAAYGSVRLIETRTMPSPDGPICTAVASVTMALVFVLPLGRSFLLPTKTEYLPMSARQPNQYPPGFSVNLVTDDEPRTRVPNVRVSDFRSRLVGVAGVFKEASWLARLPAGVSMVAGGWHGVLLLSTEKLRHADRPVEFEKFNIGWLFLSRDKELLLPDMGDASMAPVIGGAARN